MEKLYQLIEQKREEKNLSIRKISQALDFSEQTYLNAKSGKSDLGSKTLFRIMVFVGIDDLENIKQYVV